MNKQIDKQTNKQTTKLDDIHNIHIKMLYIRWRRGRAREGTRRCFNMSTIETHRNRFGHVSIKSTSDNQLAIVLSISCRLIVRDWIMN